MNTSRCFRALFLSMALFSGSLVEGAEDGFVSLFDGKKYKSLKRHLRTSYNMTPEQYREYFGLPRDYPMVAPNYAAARSELAKTMGLGQQRKKSGGKGGRKKAA